MDGTGVAPTVGDGWLVWESPGKPVSVRLSPDVTGRLAMAVREGFKALPRRGLETGGLLIGTRRAENYPVIIEIDDFEAVESEHAAGPAYLLSPADRSLLEERISARKAAGGNGSIVGFYRGHTRRDFAIAEEDAFLFSTYFKEPSDVFLLIKPSEVGSPIGGFIIREEGKVISDTPYAQFRLEGTIAIPAARETPVRAIGESQAPVPAVRTIPPPAQREKTWKARRTIWPVAAGVMVLAAALIFGIRMRAPHSTPAKPGLPLALNVTSVGNSLRLSWDHPLPRHSGHAILWIKDGQEEREQQLELDAKQLSEGSVVYWPRHSDVDFRFELLAPGGTVTQSVRSIGGPTKPFVVNPAPALAAVVTPPVPVPSQKPPRKDRIPARASAPRPKTPLQNRVVAASLQPSRTFALPRPKSNLVPGGTPSVPDPPSIQPAPLEHSKEVLKTIEPGNSLSRAEPSFHVTVEPVSGSRRSIPLIGRRNRRADYVPPAALHNPGLSIPPNRNLARDVKINIKVYVNPAGKVDYSEVVSKVPETDRDLAVLAVFAARRWEFVPARDGDSAVPGEVILHYQFGPPAH